MQYLQFIYGWPLTDIVLIAVLAGFVFYGLWFGLIRVVGSLVGIVGGVYAASKLYLIVYAWLKSLSFGHEAIGQTIVWFLIFTIVNRLICFLFALLDRTYHLIAIIPFMKTINRLAGAVLGLIEGSLILGLLIYCAGKYLPESFWLILEFKNSRLAPYLLSFGNWVVPILPEVMKKIKSVI